MRVRCIQTPTSEIESAESRSPWLTLGREYVVLSVLADTNGQVLYRLISDDQRTPALFAATQFKVISSGIPSCWRIRIPIEGGLELAPEAWLSPGFWESYFDGDEEAETAFRAALILMIA
jgi:hypothetical protein